MFTIRTSRHYFDTHFTLYRAYVPTTKGKALVDTSFVYVFKDSRKDLRTQQFSYMKEIELCMSDDLFWSEFQVWVISNLEDAPALKNLEPELLIKAKRFLIHELMEEISVIRNGEIV